MQEPPGKATNDSVLPNSFITAPMWGRGNSPTSWRTVIPTTSKPSLRQSDREGGKNGNKSKHKEKDTCNYDQSKGFNRTVQMLQNRGHDVWRR